jgi:hypothetical protein
VSGRFLLRLPEHVHARLQAEARRLGLSLNEYCSRRLSVPGPALLVEDGARGAVARCFDLFASNLVGVVAYGSFVRGDAAGTSDVDLLVVADRAVQLTRNLYREWDAAPVAWSGRTVDPHFIHLPGDAPGTPGAWSEAAIDGVVLFERDGAVTRHLAAVRGDISAGRIVRRFVHGQPYWRITA